MRTLSEAMAALLKSRKQIGADKPSYSITIPGFGGGIADVTEWTTQRTPTYEDNDMAETSDGKAILAYADNVNAKIYVAFADSVLGYLEGTETFGTPAEVYSGASGEKFDVSITNIDSKLYLLVVRYWPDTREAQLYLSSDGTGASWSKISDFPSLRGLYYNINYRTTKICILNDGAWGVCYPATSSSSLDMMYSFWSTDDGVSWTTGAGFYCNGPAASGKTLFPVNDGVILFIKQGSTDEDMMYFSGETATELTKDYTSYGGSCIATFGGTTYLFRATEASEFSIEEYSGDGSLASYALAENFTQVKTIEVTKTTLSLGASQATGCVLCYARGAYIGTELSASYLPVKSISINRNKNMAASLDLVIDNKDGAYSPDREGVYKEKLWPNKIVTLQQGYGTDLVTTFTGLIDKISMTSFPQEIVVSCRDYMKYLLDQLVTKAVEGGNTHVLQYTAQTVEYIVTDLVTSAGLTLAETIYTTGITVADITFSWCSWADAVQELADLVGADFGCDEEGKFYFRKDYIPDTPTIAYVFQEGEDIINLGYTIDDADIYQKVVCYGQKDDGTTVFAQTNYTSRVYYNVLPHKYMKIDAGTSAQTVAAAQALTDRAEILMRSRVRICQFAAIAVPQLQIGDVIQVIESSSTISEAYRVTDLSTTMDDTYTMMITCYHHSYTE